MTVILHVLTEHTYTYILVEMACPLQYYIVATIQYIIICFFFNTNTIVFIVSHKLLYRVYSITVYYNVHV